MSTEEVRKVVLGALEEIFTDPDTILDDNFEETALFYIGMAMKAMGRYGKIKNIDDLEIAIGLFNKGINHPSATNAPNLPASINQYATAFAKRFGINQNAEDLHNAITLVKTLFCKLDRDD